MFAVAFAGRRVIWRYGYKMELEVKRPVLVPVFTKFSPHILHAMLKSGFGRTMLGYNHSINPQS